MTASWATPSADARPPAVDIPEPLGAGAIGIDASNHRDGSPPGAQRRMSTAFTREGSTRTTTLCSPG